ncbi:hypothetical protein V8G54_004453 [Vigna mungo]|uniref:Uncharacterized protein n=1 Tax=Vigna mungo TaxID=3915 RepID=A0AAQ3SFT0_VIGMU
MQTCKPLGENSTEFINYVALLGTSKTSILFDDWDHVSENVKNQIWQSILKLQELSKKTVAWQPVKCAVIGLASCEECWLHVEDCSMWVQIAEEGILAVILVFVYAAIFGFGLERRFTFLRAASINSLFLVVKTTTIIVHLLPRFEGHWM